MTIMKKNMKKSHEGVKIKFLLISVILHYF